MTIYLLRGAYANEYELQNYSPLQNKYDIRVITTHHQLSPLTLPSTHLWSPSDLPQFPGRKQILNRLIGGEQWFVGLEQFISENNNSQDAVILHTAETYTPYTHQAVELRKQGKIAKLVCTCWETIPHNNEKLSRLRQWKKEAIENVDIFHTPTQKAKNALIVEGASADKIRVIPYGVDLTVFQPKSKSQTSSKKRPVVVFVARLVPEKGILDIEKCARAYPGYDFVVIGQGSRPPRGVNVFVRQVPYSEIHTAYQSADIFLSASKGTDTWEEQYGMAVVEAMASGLPVIATDCGAIAEVVGNAGIIVQNVEEMTRAVGQVASDSARAKNLAVRSLKRARARYDALKSSKALSRLYD